MSTTKSVLIVIAAAGILSACSSSAPKLDDSSTAKSTVAQVVIPAHMDPNSELAKNRSVYFDFDDFTVKKEYTSVVERHGKYGSANSQLKIKVEGNTDERGGREYNLALGQKRAEAVRQALSLSGVSESQLEAVSYGKEKPAAQGSSEADLAKNRRVEIRY